MSLESTIFDTLKGFVANRVYPDVAPAGTPTPFYTYQQVGGSAINFLDAAVPGKENARMQINSWAATRKEAKALALQAANALRVVASLQTTVLGAQVSVYEPDTGLRGSRQDFSMWYTP